MFLAGAISSLFLAGCSHAAQVQDLNLPLSTLAKVVANKSPRGIRLISPNGREFSSNYFGTPGRFDEDASAKPQRSYAVMTILGDRRPYTIVVTVIREARNQQSLNEYRKLGTDAVIAKELVRRIKADLANRREDRNVIDDFRAF